MAEKIINIAGKEVGLKATANTPRMYRMTYKRDIFKDMQVLQEHTNKKNNNISEIPIESLEMFENIAYVMAKQYNPEIEKDMGEWLDNFEMFSIYEVLPEILDLWRENNQKQVESKKNLERVLEN